MGDLDLLFQGHLAILDLEFSQFGGCNTITRTIMAAFGPNLHRICIYQGFKPDSILGDLDLHFQGHLALQGLKFTRFGSCNAITQKSISQNRTKLAQNMHLVGLQT